jgi:uncharacterized membrane protein
MSLDLALIVFHHADRADRAYADVHDAVGDAQWMSKIAFAERHKHHRLVIRGTIAGRYVDFDGEGDATNDSAVHGAAVGAAAGLLLGPAGMAAGMVAGAAAGGTSGARSAPEMHDALIDQVRAELETGESAVVCLAPPNEVDDLVRAFATSDGRLVRHALTPEAAGALEAAVADRPAAG